MQEDRRHWTTKAEFYRLTYDRKQVSKLLDVSPRSVARLEKRGMLVSFSIGGMRKFSARSVEQYLKRTRS
jgi:DNA-binding transcriptional MerR regulator